MREGMTHVVLAPAPDVTDLDEWYSWLDGALALRHDSRWHCEREGLAADLPEDEAARVLRLARETLGDALVAFSEPQEGRVLITEAVSGRSIDE